MKILITGGHLTPALSFIDFVKKEFGKDEIIFVGRTHSRKSSKQKSLEKQEVTNRKIAFVPFSSPKLSKNTLFEKIKALPLLFIAVIKAILIIMKQKPDVLVSFGGYLAVPISFASWIMRVPIITHEQTRTAGVANKIISKIASKIAISYKESFKFYPKSRTVLTGSLIRSNILAVNKVSPIWINYSNKIPIIYITGGSQGSEIINHTVAQIIKELTKDWIVIHQCGNKTNNRNYKNELSKIKKSLHKNFKNRYHIREWLNENELSWVYSHSKAIVSRAGANTTEEIASRGIPSVLIPLPFSHNEEQLLNAQALSENDQAILLEQKHLNPESLLESIQQIKKYSRKFSRNLELFTQTKNSEKKLYQLISETVNKSNK